MLRMATRRAAVSFTTIKTRIRSARDVTLGFSPAANGGRVGEHVTQTDQWERRIGAATLAPKLYDKRRKSFHCEPPFWFDYYSAQNIFVAG